MDTLPVSHFTTESLRPRDQFEAWRQSISVIFDVWSQPERGPEQGFRASVHAWHLGRLIVSRADFEAQRFRREEPRARADGLDHYLVQLYATGGLVGTADGRERILHAGDVQILDLSRPSATEAKASGTVAIVVPREALRDVAPAAHDLHGLVLRGSGGTGGLLADYMRLLVVRAAAVDAAAAPFVGRATTEMIAACFHTTPETAARAKTALEATTLLRIRRHIEIALGSPTLGPDELCRHFRISRTQLYRLFEPLGGVAAYVQKRRLARARAELSDPAHGHRPIYDIAFGWGFSSEAHFSRAFRRAFGVTPSETRAQAHTPPRTVRQPTPGVGCVTGGYEEWVRQLAAA